MIRPLALTRQPLRGAIAGAKEDPPALRAGPSTLAPAIASGLAYCISNTKGSLVGLPLE